MESEEELRNCMGNGKWYMDKTVAMQEDWQQALKLQLIGCVN